MTLFFPLKKITLKKICQQFKTRVELEIRVPQIYTGHLGKISPQTPNQPLPHHSKISLNNSKISPNHKPDSIQSIWFINLATLQITSQILSFYWTVQPNSIIITISTYT